MPSNDIDQTARRRRQQEGLYLAGVVLAFAIWVVLILPSLPPKFYFGPGSSASGGLGMNWRPQPLALLPAVLALVLATGAWVTDRENTRRLPWFGVIIAAFFVTLATATHWLSAASLWVVGLAWDNWAISVPVFLATGMGFVAYVIRFGGPGWWSGPGGQGDDRDDRRS